MSTLARIIRLNSLKYTFFNAIRNYSTQNDFKMFKSEPSPRLTSIVNPWVWQQNTNFELPQINQFNINLPSGMTWTPFIREQTDKVIEEPTDSAVDNTIQAARLIVIRRKKMKKHKLKKLRKKMKFEWAKLRQKRELRKEKEFQAGLIQQCKTAESFSAENYVNERLAKFKETIVLNSKEQKLPESVIHAYMGLIDSKNKVK